MRSQAPLTFAYDTERQRIKQVAPDGTTHYINDTSAGLKVEKFIGASSMRWNNYVYAAGGIVAVVYDNVGGTSSTRYFHKDHLGSTAVITNESGAVVETLAYDPWGKRRHPNGNDDPTNSITSLTDRGFTGHEHLQEVALVHMNGRVYDPLLGRFLSADPHIQDPGDTQSFNRYSYVKNNPLAYTDPSGFFFKSIMKFFQKNPILATVIGIVAAVVAGPAGFAWIGASLSWQGGMIAGAVSGLLTGGIKGAIIGGIGGAATGYLGISNLGLGDLNFLGQAVAIGATQGTLAEVQGGSFGAAFLAAGFTSIAGSALQARFPGKSFEAIAAKTIATAVIGGTASVIGGGKFQNGAATGAFVYLFSTLAREIETLAWRTTVVGGTEAQQDAIAKSLRRIDGTSAGRDLAASISSKEITVSIQRFYNPLTGLEVLNADGTFPPNAVVRMSPQFVDGLVCCYIDVSGGSSPFVLDRVLAHELGHLTGSDDGPSPARMENVNRWENPVMRQLSPNQPDRGEYYGSPLFAIP